MDRELLRVLGVPARPMGEHYRSNPRHQTVAIAQVRWGPDRAQGLLMQLREISRMGTSAIADRAPPVGVTLRLRLIAPESTPWIEAVVLAVEPQERPALRVRLRFLEPCPTVFLKAALLGPANPDEPAH